MTVPAFIPGQQQPQAAQPPVQQPQTPAAPQAPIQPAQVIHQTPQTQYATPLQAQPTQAPQPFVPAAPAPAAAPQQAPQAAVGFDVNTPIQAGPGVPPELVGRPLGQALQMYAVLRDQYGRNLPQPASLGQQAVAAQQQAQQQQAAAPQQQKSFWADPEGAINRIVEQKLGNTVQQLTLPQQVQQAKTLAAANIPNSAALEAAVIQRVQGVDPQVLTNPQAWEMAYKLAYADMAMSGQAPQQAQAQPQTMQAQQPQVLPPVNSQQVWQPAPAAFFSEQPQASPANALALTPEERDMARKMNLPEAQYAAWKAGVIAQQPAGGAR